MTELSQTYLIKNLIKLIIKSKSFFFSYKNLMESSTHELIVRQLKFHKFEVMDLIEI